MTSAISGFLRYLEKVWSEQFSGTRPAGMIDSHLIKTTLKTILACRSLALAIRQLTEPILKYFCIHKLLALD